jgi:hypothetical protein
MNLSELIENEATVTIEHRGQKLEVTCKPELITPAYRHELIERVIRSLETPVEILEPEAGTATEAEPAEGGEGGAAEISAPAVIEKLDADTELLLEVCTGWSMVEGKGKQTRPVPFTRESLKRCSYGLRLAIVRAVTQEAQNPSSAGA